MHLSGRNWERLNEVIHAAAFVFKAKSLYLLEFKKVILFFSALDKDSISKISKLFDFEKPLVQLIVLIISFKGKGPFFLKKLV